MSDLRTPLESAGVRTLGGWSHRLNVGRTFLSAGSEKPLTVVGQECPTHTRVLPSLYSVFVVLQADFQLMDGLVDGVNRFHAMPAEIVGGVFEVLL